jgi:O-methyltransferase involved in polyketide biosynthesis
MTDDKPFAGEIDLTRPSVTRIYDFLLGGRDNFAADRQMARRMESINPALPQLVQQNREFVCAAAARAAAAGISQFLDLGSGLPTHPAVHEAAREVNPNARVCYVDRDPVAVLHAATLLARGAGLAAVRADLTKPETVLADPTVRLVIDPSQPTAIIMAAVLHFMPADTAATVVAEYMSRVAHGSWLIVSSGHYPDRDLAERLQRAARHIRFWNHSAEDVTAVLGGLEPVAPGVCEASRWIAGTGGVPSGRPAYVLAAAAIKSPVTQ